MDAVSYDNVEDAWKQVKTIVTNKPLILLTFALTSLYFVVTGIQVSIAKKFDCVVLVYFVHDQNHQHEPNQRHNSLRYNMFQLSIAWSICWRVISRLTRRL
jgi:hypothetical protein